MRRHVLILIMGLFYWSLSAQQIPENRYGLAVVNSPDLYVKQAANDSNQLMVDLQKYIPDISMKIYYATKDNFTHRVLYPESRIFLRLPAAKALRAVEADLHTHGLGLLIFDAYRPYSITEKMWTVVPDDRYAADPKHGSGHNRGLSVDLTLIDLKTGKMVRMPTGFDNFTLRAHRDYTNLPDEIIRNRSLLESVMVSHGFIPLSTEWWHFSYPHAEDYPLMNISFKSLDSLQRNNH